MAAITILGGGGWGTALSGLLAEKGHTVTLWALFYGRRPAQGEN
jgi:glycerol-3-phosphate dehydrogenase